MSDIILSPNSQYLEQVMTKALLEDKDYVVNVIRVFEEHYFDSAELQQIFSYVSSYFKTHREIPTKDTVINSISIESKESVQTYLDELDNMDIDIIRHRDWLMDQTDIFLKDKAIKDAIRRSVDIIDANENTYDIRKLVEEALCRTMDIDLGLDYFGDLGPRLHKMFTDDTQRIPTYFPVFDEFINGGFPPKTLSVLTARIHGFKCVCGDVKVDILMDNKEKCEKIGDLYKYTCNNEFIKIEDGNMKQKGVKKIDLFINKYGEEEGTRRYNDYINNRKKRKPNTGIPINTLEFYINKYGEEEGNRKYNEKNTKISDKGRCTLKWFINKHGEQQGTKAYKQYIDRQKHSHSEKGYIEKYGEEEGKKEWQKRMFHMKHTTSLEGFIMRHGEEKGSKKWEERQIKWQNTLKAKSPEEIERINRAKINTRGFSKVSQELFWKIVQKLPYLQDVYFAELNEDKQPDKSGTNHEYMILTDERKIFFPDFLIESEKKIIEFDGDYWHGSTGNKAKDNEREYKLIELGYKILRIKQFEWNADPVGIIQKCMDFINE